MAINTNGYLTASFTGVGAGADILTARNVNANTRKFGTVWVTGTFVGTVILEGSPPGANTWGVIGTFTTPTSVNIGLGHDEDIRVSMSAFTSGTANVFVAINN